MDKNLTEEEKKEFCKKYNINPEELGKILDEFQALEELENDNG